MFTDFAFTLSDNTVAVPEYLCCIRDRDDSVSRSRRKFNSATVDNLPFDEFERCLDVTENKPSMRREALAYRVLHSMMTICFLFCCSVKERRRTVVSRVASLVRA